MGKLRETRKFCPGILWLPSPSQLNVTKDIVCGTMRSSPFSAEMWEEFLLSLRLQLLYNLVMYFIYVIYEGRSQNLNKSLSLIRNF